MARILLSLLYLILPKDSSPSWWGWQGAVSKGGACRNQSSLWSVWAGNRQARSVLPTIPLKGRIYSGVRVKCFLYFILVPGWSCLSTHPQTPPLLWTIVWVKNYLQLRSHFNPILPIKTLWGKFNTLFRNSFLSFQLR